MCNIDKTISSKIVVYEFWFLSNLRVKSPNIKWIEDNIFEGIFWHIDFILLFDFVFDFQNKKKMYILKWCLNSFERIFRKIDMHTLIPSNVLFLIVFNMSNFTRR